MLSIEGQEEIFVLIIDETYGGSEDTYEEDSALYQQGLQLEFGVKFREENVGPGADVPAFLTVLLDTVAVPIWLLIFPAFFLGKPINDNMNAWIEIANKIRHFFKKPVILSRNGAAVIAVEAIFKEIGGMPKYLQLLSYRVEFLDDVNMLESLDMSAVIEETPATLNLSRVWHVFEIEVDKDKYRVGIDGKKVEVLRIE